jgi:hypothetical protein
MSANHRYAVVEGGEVVNIILWDKDSSSWVPPDSWTVIAEPEALRQSLTYNIGGDESPDGDAE